MHSWQLIKICLGCIFSLGLVSSADTPPVDQTMLTVLQKLQITPQQYMLHHGGRTEKLWHRDEMDQLANALARSFHLNHPQKMLDTRSIEYKATGSWKRKLLISIRVVNMKPEQTWSQPYISIRLSGDGKPGIHFYQAREQLKTVLKDVNVSANLDFAIQGTKPAILDGKLYVKSALRQLHATEVEAVQDYPLISQSAYSPLMEQKLRTRGGWMNVQVAARIDRTHQQMIFTLGSPIITIEY